MATEEEANAARRQHAETLRQSGAHSVGVEQAEGSGDWVVVAHVAPGQKVSLPASLASSARGRKIDVPLVVRRTKPFQLE